MSFSLDNVVPWGRSFEEYVGMFSLSSDDLDKHILGCGDGPAAFNSELTKRGGRVTSIDPLYDCSLGDIRGRIKETFNTVMEQLRGSIDSFVWNQISSPEELGRIRMEAMSCFLADYERGRNEKRYQAESLPTLPFRDQTFDLAVCSHLLFLYSEQLALDFHMESIRELCRVAREVRIFPLLELNGSRSRHMDSILQQLIDEGFTCQLETVVYEFQKGGNQMLRVSLIHRP